MCAWCFHRGLFDVINDAIFSPALTLFIQQDEVQHRRDEFARLLDEHEQVVRELRRIESSGELQSLVEISSGRAEEALSFPGLNLVKQEEWEFAGEMKKITVDDGYSEEQVKNINQKLKTIINKNYETYNQQNYKTFAND